MGSIAPAKPSSLAEAAGARLRAHLVFVDERGFLMLPVAQRTWGVLALPWDRRCVHRGRRVRRLLQGQSLIHIGWLPPYAPDLNPMDKGWGWMESHRLANHAPRELDQSALSVAEASPRARERQDLLRGFVRATGLPVRL